MKTKKKAPGILPNDKWLKQNGYADLVKAKKSRPELFAHIKQKRK